MVETFEVLAEPNRRRILDELRQGDRAVNDLVAALGLSQPLVSKHLRVLRDAGLVDATVDGPRRVYRLTAEPLREVDEWLTPYRAVWAARLAALGSHRDDMPDQGDDDDDHPRRGPRHARARR